MIFDNKNIKIKMLLTNQELILLQILRTLWWETPDILSCRMYSNSNVLRSEWTLPMSTKHFQMLQVQEHSLVARMIYSISVMVHQNVQMSIFRKMIRYTPQLVADACQCRELTPIRIGIVQWRTISNRYEQIKILTRKHESCRIATSFLKGRKVNRV